ncbi:DsrE family protein [Albibacterium indicum]|uniref:DsrE family protein n=1 Tax=Albibacterium indicum TaxID=2292082 RepID=UPI000E527223|nr:DsrE family protein [Pedobacter indicus]
MKSIIVITTFLIAIGILLIPYSGFSQIENQRGIAEFTPATAKLDNYKALYIINSSDERRVKGALKNIGNALNDPRLKGKLQIELVVFGDGVEIFKRGSLYEETLSDLKSKGVALVQCENTLKERKIDKSELYPFISYVPTGNGEIILRHYEGWAIIHP